MATGLGEHLPNHPVYLPLFQQFVVAFESQVQSAKTVKLQLCPC